MSSLRVRVFDTKGMSFSDLLSYIKMAWVMHYTQNFVLQTPFGGKLFKYTQLFITIRKSYSFYHFFHKYRPLYMTEATLNANNNIYICSIFSSKLHILMYDRIKNMYTQISEAYLFLAYGKSFITYLLKNPHIEWSVCRF